jgi:hypothetical protein
MNEQTPPPGARSRERAHDRSDDAHAHGRSGHGTRRDASFEAQDISAARLAARALDQTRELLRRELDLARAEADKSLVRVGAAIGLMAGAMVISLVALNVLAGALVAALAELGLDPAWGAIVVGLGLALIAGIMVAVAARDLKKVRLAPDRVADSVRADIETVRETTDGRS